MGISYLIPVADTGTVRAYTYAHTNTYALHGQMCPHAEATSDSAAAALVRKTNIKESDAEIVATNEKQIHFPVRIL